MVQRTMNEIEQRSFGPSVPIKILDPRFEVPVVEAQAAKK
jgi:hypothetical protein